MSENNKSAERQNVSNEETEISGESQKHGKKKLNLNVKSTPKSLKRKKSLVDRVDEGIESLIPRQVEDQQVGEFSIFDQQVSESSISQQVENQLVEEIETSSSNKRVDGNSKVVVPENPVPGIFNDDEIPVDYDEENDEHEFEAQLDDNENDGQGEEEGEVGGLSQTLLPEKVQMSTSQTEVGSDPSNSSSNPRSPPPIQAGKNEEKGDEKSGIGRSFQTLLPKRTQTSNPQTGVGSDSSFSIFMPKSPLPLPSRHKVGHIAHISTHQAANPPLNFETCHRNPPTDVTVNPLTGRPLFRSHESTTMGMGATGKGQDCRERKTSTFFSR